MEQPEYQTYKVNLYRAENSPRSTVKVRDFTLELGTTSGDPSTGFNPAETLLSAVAGCITSSFLLVAKNSHVPVGAVSVEVSGIRQRMPPQLISVSYVISIQSSAENEKIERLLSIAERNSTVLSTLRKAIPVNGSWKRAPVQSSSH